MAIKIDLIADVKGVIKGTDKIGDALQDVADDLKDVGKEGKSLDDKVSEAFRSMGKDASEAGRKIGKEVKDGTDKAGEGLDDMKSEAASTAKETAASFGSIEDAAGALQEVAANAFAGLGPAGMAAGLVAAAGIGLAISALTENAEKINENKDKMLSLAQTIRDNGGALTEADYVTNMEEYGYAIQDTKEWFEIFQADAVSGFEQIRDLAKGTGLATKQIFQGGFGDVNEAKKTLRVVQDELDKLREKKDAVYQMEGALLPAEDVGRLDSLEKTEKLILDNIAAQEGAIEVEQIRKRAIEGTTAAQEEENEALAEKIDHLNDMASKIEGAVASELDLLDAIAGTAEEMTKNNSTWRDGSQAARDLERDILGNVSALSEWGQKQVDAGQDVDVVNGKVMAYRDTLIDQATKFFGSRDAAAAYIDQILQTPKKVNTDVNLNGIPDAEEQMKRFTEKPRTIPIQVLPDGTEVERYIMSQQGRKIFIDVAPRGGGQALALP
jgi:hypothetical protein